MFNCRFYRVCSHFITRQYFGSKTRLPRWKCSQGVQSCCAFRLASALLRSKSYARMKCEQTLERHTNFMWNAWKSGATYAVAATLMLQTASLPDEKRVCGWATSCSGGGGCLQTAINHDVASIAWAVYRSIGHWLQQLWLRNGAYRAYCFRRP